MTTSPVATPLARDRDEISDRHQHWMNVNHRNPLEKRHDATRHGLDREQAKALMDPEQVDTEDAQRTLRDFPDQPPPRELLLSGLTAEQPMLMVTTLANVLNSIRNTRIGIEMLSEYAWMMGPDSASDDLAVGDRTSICDDALEFLVRFCRAYGVPLPEDGADMGEDLVRAVAAVRAA